MNLGQKKFAPYNAEILVIGPEGETRNHIELALLDVATRDEVGISISFSERLEALNGSDGDERVFTAILVDEELIDDVNRDLLPTLFSAQAAVPVIIIGCEPGIDAAANAIRYGAADCVARSEITPNSIWRAIVCATERKHSEAKLAWLASTDPLTGLKNRRAFFGFLEKALNQSERIDRHCAVMVLDIDGFKPINDTLGHNAGDNLLKAIAARIAGQLRKTDIVARIGGDEFAIAATNLKSPSDALEIAEKVVMAITSIKFAAGSAVSLSASVGITVYPGDNSPAENLVSHADMAMYRSKRSRSGSISFSMTR